MRNCLVTKLKESVQNDSLLKFGEVRMSNISGTTILGLKGNGKISVSVIGEGSITDFSGNPYTTPFEPTLNPDYNTWIKFSSGTQISITPKYNILNYYIEGATKLDIPTMVSGTELLQVNQTGASEINFKTFKVLPSSMIYFTASSSDATASDVQYLPTGLLGLSYTNLTNAPSINIADLARLTSLTSLSLQYNLNVSGNISSISGLTNLTSLNIQGTSINGSVKDMLDAMAQNRTSGELTIFPSVYVTNVHTHVRFTENGWEDIA